MAEMKTAGVAMTRSEDTAPGQNPSASVVTACRYIQNTWIWGHSRITLPHFEVHLNQSLIFPK